MELQDATRAGEAAVRGCSRNRRARASPGESRQYLAGNIALFGLRRASMKDGQHAGEGLTFILDATPVIDQLHLKNEFDVESLQVSVIPADPLPENADITVGRISIYREGF